MREFERGKYGSMLTVAAMMLVFSAREATAQKHGKLGESDVKKRVEAELNDLLKPAKLKGSLERSGTMVTIEQPGATFLVAQDHVLTGTAYAAADKLNTTNDDGSTDMLASMSNFISAPYKPVSRECAKFSVVAYPEGNAAAATPACAKNIADGDARYLGTGQRVQVAKIEIEVKSEQVRLTLIDDARKPDGTAGKPQFLSRVAVQLPQGYLEQTDEDKLAEALSVAIVTQESFASVTQGLQLKSQLKTVFVPTVYTGSLQALGNHVGVSQPGTVFDVVKGNLIAGVSFERDTVHPPPPVLYVSSAPDCRLTVVKMPEGTLDAAEARCAAAVSAGTAHFLAEGQRVTVAEVAANLHSDQVVMSLLDYNPPGAPRYAAGLLFQFPHGYLATATAVSLGDAIGSVLTPDLGGPLRPGAARSLPALAAAAPAGLDQQLETIFALTKLAPDGSVQAAGTIAKLVHGAGIASAPLKSAAAPCAALFQEGALKPGRCGAPARSSRGSAAAARASLEGKPAPLRAVAGRSLADGQRVEITKIAVDRKKATIRFDLVDAGLDPATGSRRPSTVKAAVNFVFPAGFLDAADAGQVAEYVNQELQIDAQ